MNVCGDTNRPPTSASTSRERSVVVVIRPPSGIPPADALNTFARQDSNGASSSYT